MSIFGKLTAAIIETALLPVEIVKDVATLGGAITNEHEPHTVQRLRSIGKDIESALDEMKE